MIGAFLLAAEILLPGPHARLAFNERGFVTSIRENATGRELVEKPFPFVKVLMDGRKSTDRATKLAQDGDRLTFSWPDGRGELVLRTCRFEGGWLFTTESFGITNATSLSMGCFLPVCTKYLGNSLTMMSDDESGIAALDCGMDMEMTTYGDDGMRVTAVREHGFVGKTFGVVAGPRTVLASGIGALASVTGIRPSACGGPKALDSEANRLSYAFANGLSPATVDDWIRFCKLSGIGVLHQDRWYETLGTYAVKKDLYPNGFADMAKVTKRIRDAGLHVGMHMLTGCINVNDPLVATRARELIPWCSYTLAKPFAPDSTELVVNEPLDPRHDVVYTYSGNGNFLRVGDEVVQYTALRKEKPYAFLGLTRGFSGTKVSPTLPAGEPVDYLQQRYRAFYPKLGSKLIDDLADNIARVYNEGGFEQIYFDGAEGMGTPYRTDVMCRKIYERLKRSPIAEGGGFRHAWWWRSRKGAWDSSQWDSKRFVDQHIKYADIFKKSELVQPQMGWWAPRLGWEPARGHFLDEMEYYAGKCTAIDAVFSVQCVGPDMSEAIRRQMELLGNYERFRLARRFSDAAMRRLATPRAEQRLRRDASGNWMMTPVETVIRRAGNPGERSWTFERPVASKAALRVEQLWGVAETNGPVLLAAGTVPSNRTFAAPYFDCGKGRVVKFRLKGNGSGDVLRLRVSSPREYTRAECDHYLLVDFTGWREFTLPFRERQVAGDWFYEPPKMGLDTTFMNLLTYAHVSSVELSVVKEGGRPSADRIAFSDLQVVPHELRSHPQGAAVIVNGRRIPVPFAMKDSDYAELEADGWTLFGDRGKILGRAPADGLVDLKAGVNELRFEAEKSARVELTLSAFGKSFPALK